MRFGSRFQRLFWIGAVPRPSACTCLARLERSSAGELGNKASSALGAGGGQRSEDLPGTSTFFGFITTGDFACDHRGPQLAFGQIVGGINAVVIGER